jgi:hypothetical protein
LPRPRGYQRVADPFGAASEELPNPDRIQATNELKAFSAALTETNHLVTFRTPSPFSNWAMTSGVSGAIVKNEDGGSFDTDAGKDELSAAASVE